MDVVELPIEKLQRAEWNANRVDDETMAKIRRSVEQFGMVENLVVRTHPDGDGSFEVLSGNHRRDLYAQLGMETAPCVVVDVDDPHARLLAQTLNRTRGEDDPIAYRALLTDVLADLPFTAVTELLPETDRSLQSILDQLPEPGDADEFAPLEVWGVVVELAGEEEQTQLLTRLGEEGYRCRALMS